MKADKKFKTLYRLVGELSYKLSGDPYEFIVKTIIGQMLSTKVGDIITERLIGICESGKIDVDSIKKIPAENMRAIGLSWRKAHCMLDFTNSYSKEGYSAKALSLMTDDEITKKITFTKGLGSWSAKMFLIFVLGRENILPFEDVAFLQALAWYESLPSVPSKNEVKSICEKWSPYASVAARYLYTALGMGLTKEAFDSYGKR